MRVNPDLTLIADETGLIVDGINGLEVTAGVMGSALTPALLRELGDQTTVPETEDPDVESVVSAAHAELCRLGILDRSPDCVSLWERDTASYLRRYSLSTGAMLSEVQEPAKVMVIASGADPSSNSSIAHSVMDLLSESGVKVDLSACGMTAGDCLEERFHLYLDNNTEASGHLARQNCPDPWGLSVTYCLQRRRAFMRRLNRYHSVECGFCCWRSQAQRLSSTSNNGDDTPRAVQLLAGVIASAVLHELALPLRESPPRSYLEYELQDYTHSQVTYPIDLDCETCIPRSAHTEQLLLATLSVFGYERQLAYERRPVERVLPIPTQPSSMDVADHAVSTWDILLPRLTVCLNKGTSAALSDPGSHAEPPSLTTLSSFLQLTAGRRNDGSGRPWMPSAGNLCSHSLMLISHNVMGIANGLYFYIPAPHLLRRLDAPEGVVEEVVDGLAGQISVSETYVVVLGVGDLSRLQPKYSRLAYKLLLLDGGVLLRQASFVAAALDIKASIVTRWDDQRLETLCSLIPSKERVTSVLILSKARSSLRLPSDWSSQNVEQLGATPRSVARDLWVDSRWHVRFPVTLRSTVRPSWIEALRHGPRIVRRRTIELSCAETLIKRRAIKSFSNAPVDVDMLRDVLSDALRFDSSAWRWNHQHRNTLVVRVVANRIRGLAPGVYTDRLTALRATAQGIAPELCIQQEPDSAPALVWVGSPLLPALRLEGACGYRSLLLRAGAVLHHIWLSFTARGYDGSIIAGLLRTPHTFFEENTECAEVFGLGAIVLGDRKEDTKPW